MPVRQTLYTVAPKAGTPKDGAAPPVRVLLLAPYGPRGGGIGRMMEYVVDARPEGLRLERVETRGGGHVAWSAWFMLRAAARLCAAAAGAAPAIVHVNMAERGSVVRKGSLLLLARALGLPAVLHVHAAELIEFHAGLPRAAQLLVAMPFRAATVCIVLGTVWQDFLHAGLGVPLSRIEVLRNGVPRPVLRRFPAPCRTFKFVFLGNLHARKGLPDLLHALASPALRGLDWSLTVAGGGDARAAQDLATSLGITGRTIFTGWLDREATTFLLSQAGALVLPSYAEGLPLVLLEAASLGVPVVATGVGAVGEVFRHGETALLVQPGDRAALAAALLRLLADPGCARRLGRQARALYAQELTLEVFMAGLGGIYARHCLAPQGQHRRAG
jgi:glycosyltransferase involved in cell wall biosynthesis